MKKVRRRNSLGNQRGQLILKKKEGRLGCRPMARREGVGRKNGPRGGGSTPGVFGGEKGGGGTGRGAAREVWKYSGEGNGEPSF